jgi:hypothetical protein
MRFVSAQFWAQTGRCRGSCRLKTPQQATQQLRRRFGAGSAFAFVCPRVPGRVGPFFTSPFVFIGNAKEASAVSMIVAEPTLGSLSSVTDDGVWPSIQTDKPSISIGLRRAGASQSLGAVLKIAARGRNNPSALSLTVTRRVSPQPLTLNHSASNPGCSSSWGSCFSDPLADCCVASRRPLPTPHRTCHVRASGSADAPDLRVMLILSLYSFIVCLVAAALYVAVNSIESNPRHAFVLKFLIVILAIAATRSFGGQSQDRPCQEREWRCCWHGETCDSSGARRLTRKR